MLKDLIRVIQQEAHAYSDPITEFLECLFVHYDFEGAQVKLRECEAVLDGDFFLQGIKEEFVENARLFIFETYCRIHQVSFLSLSPPCCNSLPFLAMDVGPGVVRSGLRA